MLEMNEFEKIAQEIVKKKKKKKLMNFLKLFIFY